MHYVFVPIVALTSVSLQSPQQTGAQTPQNAKKTQQSTPVLVVTGTLEERGVPEVALSNPGSRDVLGPEDLQRTGARDLNDLLQYLPAVSTRPYNGGDSSAPSFSMRGMPDDGLTEYVLMLIDGVPASPMPYGWTAFSFFPLITEQVHAIELIRGGQAVRCSPNNVAGAINLITAPIPSEETYKVRNTTGSNGYSSSLFSAGDSDDKFGYLFTVGERHGDGYRDEGGFEYTSADVKLRWRYGNEDWLALRLGYIENEHQAPGGLTLAAFDVDRFGNSRPDNQFRGFRSVVDIVRHVGDQREYVESYSWFSQTRRNLERTDPVFGGPVTNFRTTDDDAYNAAVGVRSTREFEAFGLDHELHYGVRATEEWIPNRTTVTRDINTGVEIKVSDIDYELTTLSAHVDDTLRPVEDLTIVAGARAEWVAILQGTDHVTNEEQEDSQFDVLPGLSASYVLSDELAVFANYQRSFRAPQVFGLDTSLADPSQSLDFESGSSYELGVRCQSDFGLDGSVAAWRVEFDDVGFFGPTGLYENIGNIESDGVDVVLGYDFGSAARWLKGFSVRGSVTWQNSELVDAANPAFDGNESPYAWEEKAAWSFEYLTESRWRFALGGSYVGESFSDDANTVAENANGNLGLNESRKVWDAQIGREFMLGKKAEARFVIGATNVFDEEWAVHSRGGFFGGGKVAGPPRQMYCGFEISI